MFQKLPDFIYQSYWKDRWAGRKSVTYIISCLPDRDVVYVHAQKMIDTVDDTVDSASDNRHDPHDSHSI